MPDLLSPVLAITCGSRIKRGRSGGGAAGVAWWASIAMFMGSIPWLVLFQRSRLGSTRSFCVACSAESPACCCASGWHSETWATMHLDGLVWTALRGGFPIWCAGRGHFREMRGAQKPYLCMKLQVFFEVLRCAHANTGGFSWLSCSCIISAPRRAEAWRGHERARRVPAVKCCVLGACVAAVRLSGVA